MDSIVMRHLRTGFIAIAISIGMILGGAALASAQNASPQDKPEHPSAAQPSSPSSAVPAQTQNAPATMDQDNGVRPAPDKDDAARQSQSNPAAESSKTERKEIKQDVKLFDKFLDSHPGIAKELQRDPQKINDAAWVSQHPELEKWLSDHPNVREEIKENPGRFMNFEKQYEKTETPPSK